MAGHMPRKVPKQARSKQLVERILDACAAILVADGYDGVSTPRIADEADVSPGSLYQYFPSKDAIVAMTVERMINDLGAQLLAATPSLPSGSPAEQTHAVVTAALNITESNRELVRVLVEQMPRLGGSAAIRSVEERATAAVTGYIATTSGGEAGTGSVGGLPRHAGIDHPLRARRTPDSEGRVR